MDKLLLEYPWLNKVVSASKEHGLDWLLMASIALELSGGDARCRTADNVFLLAKLGPDNPNYAEHWQDMGDNIMPDTYLTDRATRWGLFQILGQVAIDGGVFTGRLINFVDIGANVRAACLLAQNVLNNNGSIDDVIRYFNAHPDRVYSLMQESRDSIDLLLNISKNAVEEEQVEQA
jgi:hypothetical protein